MDTDTTSVVKSVLEKLQASSAREFRLKLGRMYLSSGEGLIISAATIHEAEAAAEDNCRQFISDAVDAILEVSSTQYAHAMIEDALLAHMSDLQRLVQGGAGSPLSQSMIEVADKLFQRTRNSSLRRLKNEKQRFKVVANPYGAPEIWDWKGAKQYIREQFPDGVPQGYGMKTRIAEMMLEWFQQRYGKEPHISQCYTHGKVFFM